MKKNLGEQRWRQEVLGEFIAESSEVVDAATESAQSLSNQELGNRIRNIASVFLV
jgi:hypothetical protein